MLSERRTALRSSERSSSRTDGGRESSSVGVRAIASSDMRIPSKASIASQSIRPGKFRLTLNQAGNGKTGNVSPVFAERCHSGRTVLP